MRIGTRLLAVSALSGLLAACASVDPNQHDSFDLHAFAIAEVRSMAPQGSAFSQGLRSGYLDLADAERGEFDFRLWPLVRHARLGQGLGGDA
jgi:hypothetical protein